MHGSQVYLVAGHSGSLEEIDVSHPAAPVQSRGPLGGLFRPQGLAVSDARGAPTAYVGIPRGLVEVDLDTPGQMSVSRMLSGLGHPPTMHVELNQAGDTAFMARDAVLAIVDTPSMSVLYIGVPDPATSVAVNGTIAYVASEDSHAVSVLEVSMPSDPQLLATIPLGSPMAVDAQDERLYVSARGTSPVGSLHKDLMQVFDVSTPGDPRLLTTSWGSAGNSVDFQHILSDGAHVYFAGSEIGSSATNKGLVVFESRCVPDCDGSGALDFFDFLCFQNLFAASDPGADCDESGKFDFFDFLCFQNQFAAGCP